ncbi:MAG: ParB/RepB/Spo0J family partition protein, partial [Nitrospirota bacterium]|nr:ParB/RepB/Spo0J family partition protein [Nitrospirota bacterium]
MARKALGKGFEGKGLGALVPTMEADLPGLLNLDVDQVKANRYQPREIFDEAALESLAASLKQHGLIQPITVRKDEAGGYELISGERRWRAAQIAKVHQLPIIVRDYDDNEVLEIAIIENVQRANLNPVEEAAGYRQLMDRFGHAQEKLAAALSKSRSHIANLMRLLTLPDDVLDLLRDGRISAGHARALITTDHASELARRVVAQGLSVRETERLAKAALQPKAKKPQKTRSKDADTRALELDLSANIKMPVSIDQKSGGQTGQVIIRYKTM